MPPVDLVVVLVVAGCAVAGAIAGAIRMATLAAAVVAAVLAGRWAGPPAVRLLSGAPEPGRGEQVLAVAAVAILAAVLVWLAGLGLRRGMRALHLGWVDRVAGLAAGGGAAVAVLALLLGLAALGGHRPSSPWASRLADAGAGLLAAQKNSARSASPSSTPSAPTSRGQQPH